MAEESNQERQDNELEALKVGPTLFLTVPMKLLRTLKVGK